MDTKEGESCSQSSSKNKNKRLAASSSDPLEYASDTNASAERKDLDVESSSEDGTDDNSPVEMMDKEEDDIWWEPNLGPDPGFKVPPGLPSLTSLTLINKKKKKKKGFGRSCPINATGVAEGVTRE